MEDPLLDSFSEGVANLRDVQAADSIRLKPRVLFRSSVLFEANALRQLNVRTLIDLRRDGSVPVVDKEVARRVFVPLIDRNAGIALLGNLPVRVKLRLLLLWPCKGFTSQVASFLFEGNASMLLLYNTILDYSTAPMREIFAVLANQENYPVMVHCVAGKDRTGIVVALVLLICGVDLERVVSDFALSEGILRGVIESGNVRGHPELLNEKAIISPPEVLREALERIKSKHGDFEKYLELYVGIPKVQLDAIRQIMTLV